MKKYSVIILLIVCHSIAVQGDWKFWKKSSTTTTSTTTTTTASPPPLVPNPTDPTIRQTPQQSLPTNVNSGKLPRPGTEVGQDFPITKPGTVGNNGQGYRDWAIDITGAGEPGTRPQSRPSNQGPTSLNGPSQQRPQQGPPSNQRPPSPVQTPSSTSTTTTTTTTRPTPGSNLGSLLNNNPQVQPTRGPSSPTGSSPSRPAEQVNYPAIPGRPSTTSQPVHHPAPSRSPSYADIARGPNSPTQRPPIGAPTTAKPQTGNAPTAPTSTTGKKVYSSNPTYSKGNAVTDEDLEKLAEALFIKDTNNVNKHITLNLQKKTSGSSTVDEAPQPLLQVNSQALQTNTIQKVLTIYDNYNLDTKTHEHISPQQREEESLLVDTFLSTNVMSAAMRFLADKGLVQKDYYEYKDLLRRLWFNLFSRGEGKIGSSGFEHVFLSEIKGSEVIGLHNWIYFNAEESKNKANYLGYLKKVDLGDKAAIVKVHVKHNDIIKPTTTLFVGTSPELEMALYTVCFMARPDQNCPVSLGGTKFNIVTHKFKYRGKDLVGTAYPDI